MDDFDYKLYVCILKWLGPLPLLQCDSTLTFSLIENVHFDYDFIWCTLVILFLINFYSVSSVYVSYDAHSEYLMMHILSIVS